MDAPGTRLGNCEKKKLARRTTPELVQMKTLRALMSLWMQPATTWSRVRIAVN